MQIVNRNSEIVNGGWLPDMDLNHDKQIQSLLCYRYTIGQTACKKLEGLKKQSSRQTAAELRGDHHDTTIAGPRTVPVRSSIAGAKAPEISRPPRPSDVLRAGTARGPVGASSCARLKEQCDANASPDKRTSHGFANPNS